MVYSIDALIEQISDNPRQCPAVFKNVRRALLRRFPYSLFFVVEDEAVIVIACFHAAAIHRTGKNGREFIGAVFRPDANITPGSRFDGSHLQLRLKA